MNKKIKIQNLKKIFNFSKKSFSTSKNSSHFYSPKENEYFFDSPENVEVFHKDAKPFFPLFNQIQNYEKDLFFSSQKEQKIRILNKLIDFCWKNELYLEWSVHSKHKFFLLYKYYLYLLLGLLTYFTFTSIYEIILEKDFNIQNIIREEKPTTRFSDVLVI